MTKVSHTSAVDNIGSTLKLVSTGTGAYVGTAEDSTGVVESLDVFEDFDEETFDSIA